MNVAEVTRAATKLSPPEIYMSATGALAPLRAGERTRYAASVIDAHPSNAIGE